MGKKIGNLAKALGINPSKIRYWDKRGLIRFDRTESNYRYFNFQTALDTCDVMFYRDLSIPISTIQSLETNTNQEIAEILKNRKMELYKEIEFIERTVNKIDNRLIALSTFDHLKNKGLSKVSWKAPSFTSIDFNDSDLIQRYIDDPNQSLIIRYSKDYTTIHHGLINDAYEVEKRDTFDESMYIQGLYWEDTENSQSNFDEFIEYCENRNLVTGDFVAQYLTTSGKPQKIDYYIGRLKVLRSET